MKRCCVSYIGKYKGILSSIQGKAVCFTTKEILSGIQLHESDFYLNRNY